MKLISLLVKIKGFMFGGRRRKIRTYCVGEYSDSESKSVMLWSCLCYDEVGTLTTVDGKMNTDKHIKVLDQNVYFRRIMSHSMCPEQLIAGKLKIICPLCHGLLRPQHYRKCMMEAYIINRKKTKTKTDLQGVVMAEWGTITLE